MEGYSHEKYAKAMSEFGLPQKLPLSSGYIIERKIPGTQYKDAIGLYPVFSCHDWSMVPQDLQTFAERYITVSLVTDPFSAVSVEFLEQYFDIMRPFKTHYITHFNQPLQKIVRRSSRQDAYKALEMMDVEICHQPIKYLNEWVSLYENIIKKHNVDAINKFSVRSFKFQLEIPGMVMFLGRQGPEIVGAVLYLMHDSVCYGHLAAFTSAGYRIKAFNGILWRALEYMEKRGIQYLNHGGAAGTNEDPNDGLAVFKKGWSNEVRQVYFCGKIYDIEKYQVLCAQRNVEQTDFFPAYRSGEFHSA